MAELDDHLRKTNREYRDGNMTWWRQRVKDRFGVNIPEPTEENDVGATVRVRSPDKHYHYPPAANGTPIWPMILALIVSLATLGLVLWMLLKPADKDPSLNPGGLSIEVVKVPTADPATP